MIKRSLIYSLVTLITLCMFFLFTEKVIGIVLLMECMYYIMAIVYVRIVSRFNWIYACILLKKTVKFQY